MAEQQFYEAPIMADRLDNGDFIVYLDENFWANDLRHGRSDNMGGIFKDLEQFDTRDSTLTHSDGSTETGVMGVIVPAKKLEKLQSVLAKYNVTPRFITPQQRGVTADSRTFTERFDPSQLLGAAAQTGKAMLGATASVVPALHTARGMAEAAKY
jgi:hypothetical protein